MPEHSEQPAKPISKQLAWQQRMIAAGQCARCGEPLDGDSKRTCIKCLRHEADRARNGKPRTNAVIRRLTPEQEQQIADEYAAIRGTMKRRPNRLVAALCERYGISFARLRLVVRKAVTDGQV